jgi:hypothetical protein
VPALAVNTDPATAVPEMLGNAVLAGAAAAGVTTAVCAEVAELVPAEFAAVTSTRIVRPTSAETTV